MTPLTAAVLTALYPLGPALAQQNDQDSGDRAVEEVIVTGSRIRRDTFSSSTPVDVVMTEQATVQGISDVATLLQTTTVAQGAPQVTPASTGVFVENGGLGTATLSLRGLGANRTLMLLNGRRAGPSGVQGSVSAFDLNVIPLSAIERVEVLKDGASSIYGSDAVAGVVNIITKKDEGGSFDVFYNQPERSGGERYRINGSWGKQFDRAYFRVTADYNKQEILKRGDRDYFKCDEDYVFEPGTNLAERADLIDPRTGQYFCDGTTWGHVWVYDYAENVGDGTTNAGPPVFLMQYDFDGYLAQFGVPPLAPAGDNPNWMTAPPGWYPVSRGDPLTNSVEDSDHPLHDTTTLVPESEVSTIFVEGEYEFSDNLKGYTELLLNRRKTTDIGFRQIWSYVYNYDSGDLGWGSDPFSVGWTGAQWLSPLAITDHSDQQVTVDYQRFVAGLTGENENFLPGWNWDLSFQYSRSEGDYMDDQVLTDALEYPFWRTGSCVGEVTPVSNRECVDIQWLDPDFLRGNIPQDVKDFLFDTEVGTTKYTQWSVEGYMSGEVFEMPAGPAAVAVGFHYRNDEIVDTPGPITLAKNAWLAGAAGITAGDQTTKAVFGEVELPLLADVPAIRSLNFTGSVRYTDVNTYGDDTTYKVGLNWTVTDQFRVRSTYGTSFRTPALYELYLADQTSYISARNSDPCINWGSKLANGEISQRTADNCAADGLAPDHLFTVSPTVQTGGGAGILDAETSDALTVGMVWQPAFTELSMSLDYFDIEVKDEVDVIGAQRIVEGCYESQFFPNEPLCDLFTRSAPDDPLPNAILTIRDSYINVARQQLRGMDLALRWVKEMPANLGTLTVDSQHTFNFEDTVALFDETEEDHSGEAGHPEWVGNLNLTLDKDAWSFFWGMNFIGSTSNYAHFGRNTVQYVFGSDSAGGGDTVEIDLKAESTMYHNFSVSRDFENGVRLRVGISNVFDELPPRMTNQGTGNEVDVLGQVAFYSQYDWLARRYFVNLSMDF